jgi:hypothetical protein
MPVKIQSGHVVYLIFRLYVSNREQTVTVYDATAIAQDEVEAKDIVAQYHYPNNCDGLLRACLEFTDILMESDGT